MNTLRAKIAILLVVAILSVRHYHLGDARHAWAAIA